MTGVQNGINAGIGWFLSGWLGTYIGVGANGITLVINDVIGLGFSDRYFEVCSDGNLESLVIGVQDGINSGVGSFIFGGVLWKCRLNYTRDW